MERVSHGTVMGIVKKVTSVALAVLLLASFNFAAFYISQGDPLLWMVPKGSDYEIKEMIIDEARLDEPLYVQYLDYMLDTFTGDFRVSTSAFRGVDIQDIIWDDAGNTLALLSLGLVGSLALGAALEMAVGRRRAGARAALAHGVSLLLMSMPVFALSLMVMWGIVQFDVGLPLWGDGTSAPYDEGDLRSVAEHIILPVSLVVLSSAGMASLLVREGLRPTGAAGAPMNGWMPAFASGLVRLRPAPHFFVAWTMAVALFVDAAFSYDGLGSMMLTALYHLDFPLLMAVVSIASLITLAASLLTSACLHLVAGRRLTDSLSDWGRREPAGAAPAPSGEPAPAVRRDWIDAAWSWFRSSAAGMAALAVLAVVIVLGVLAPVIAPAPDPSGLEYLEPYVYPDWRNPLPPSLEPSPYSGMTHYLGTDPVGRDVLSLWLFGARDAGLLVAALVLGAVAIGLAIGALASETADISGRAPRAADLLLTAGGRAMVAVPLPLFIAARFVTQRDISLAPVFLLLAFYAWAWFLIARPVRAATRRANGLVSRSVWLPSSLAESLSVAKFAAPVAFLVQFQLCAIGFGSGSDVTWGRLMDTAYSYAAFMTGDWHLILPPLVGVTVVCAAAFVLLDRAEHAVRAAAPAP
ncbi:MAG: hypothetical protein AB1793_02310 [Candidatus Thermoplasmatota archaeon]